MHQSPIAGAPAFRLPGNVKDTTQKVVLQASSFLHNMINQPGMHAVNRGWESGKLMLDFM